MDDAAGSPKSCRSSIQVLLAARRQRRSGTARQSNRMFPGHDDPHEGRRVAEGLGPACSCGSRSPARPARASLAVRSVRTNRSAVAHACPPRPDRAARHRQHRAIDMKVELSAHRACAFWRQGRPRRHWLFTYDAPTTDSAQGASDARAPRHVRFTDICKEPVEISPLDNLLALKKIVLNAALQGGAARSLRTDNLARASRHRSAADGNRGAREFCRGFARWREAAPRQRREQPSAKSCSRLGELYREKARRRPPSATSQTAASMRSGSPVSHFKTKQDILLTSWGKASPKACARPKPSMAPAAAARAAAGPRRSARISAPSWKKRQRLHSRCCFDSALTSDWRAAGHTSR